MLLPTYPLRTPRLELRPFTAGDLDYLRAVHTREDVTRYLYWAPMDEDELRRLLAKKVRCRALSMPGDGIDLAAQLTGTGEVVGDGSFVWISAEHRTGEVGFVVHPEHQRRGFAVEIAAAMMRLGFEQVGVHRVIGRCDARNTGSAAVLERLGMRREAHLVQNEWVKGQWCDELDYAILHDEWRTRPVDGGARAAPST